jgi:hypothetical protein
MRNVEEKWGGDRRREEKNGAKSTNETQEKRNKK